jgi:hypothetical protein
MQCNYVLREQPITVGFSGRKIQAKSIERKRVSMQRTELSRMDKQRGQSLLETSRVV